MGRSKPTLHYAVLPFAAQALFANKENTQSAGAAVTGNGAACIGIVDVFKLAAVGLYRFQYSLHTFICNRSVGDEEGFIIQIIPFA